MSTTSVYRRCLVCGNDAPAGDVFCVECGASLAAAPVQTGLVKLSQSQFSLPDYLRQDIARPDQLRSMLADESGTGSGMVWIGFVLAGISVAFSTLTGGGLILLGAGVALVTGGIWRMRRHPEALTRAGMAIAAISLLVLGSIALQLLGWPPGRADRTAALIRLEREATPRAAVSEAVAATDAAVPMFGATPDRRGVQSGPGPTGGVATLWRAYTGGEVYSSPVVVGDVVYIGTKGGYLAALDRETGRERWRFDLGGYIVRATPAVVNGMAYIGAGYALYAIDIATGDERWRVPIRFAGAASPTVVGDTVYVASQEGQVYAVDLGDGTLRWQRDVEGLVFGPPAVADGKVFVVGDTGHLLALDAATGRIAWQERIERLVRAGPVVAENRVYIASTEPAVLAFAADTGEPVWASDLGGEAMPAVTAERVILGSAQQGLYALTVGDGAVSWLVPTGAPVTTAPAIVGDTVYVGSGSTLYAVDIVAGDVRWTFPAGGILLTTPAVSGGVVFIGDSDGYLYAIAGERDSQSADS